MSIKIFDCSNSSSRPGHRGGGGPLENDVMAQLKKHASKHGCEYVNSSEEAQVIVTNDVFTQEVLATRKPLLKRMDGIFWQKSLMDRNQVYHEAAKQADVIVFISDYSFESYVKLYDAPRRHGVARNWVDPEIFFAKDIVSSRERIQAISVATDWDRPEKRGKEILVLAKKCPDVDFLLIGHQHFDSVPKNVKAIGYAADKAEMARLFWESDFMVNLSYRDPAPKVVAQASACGLPVLHAKSGGTNEVIFTGIGIPDPETDDAEHVPLLNKECVLFAFDMMIKTSNFLRDQAISLSIKHSQKRFDEMLSGYFGQIHALAK